jgi:hypothetical protein
MEVRILTFPGSSPAVLSANPISPACAGQAGRIEESNGKGTRETRVSRVLLASVTLNWRKPFSLAGLLHLLLNLHLHLTIVMCRKGTIDSTGAHWRSGASAGLPLRGQIRAKAGGSVASTPAGSSPPSAVGSRAPSALPSHKPTAPVPIQYPSILQSPEDRAAPVSNGSPFPGGSPMMPRVAAASRLYGSPAGTGAAVAGMEVQSVAMPQLPVPYKPAAGGYRVGGALGSSPRRAEILAVHTNEVRPDCTGSARRDQGAYVLLTQSHR